MERRKVTHQDLIMLQYFWDNKRDLTRYCDFELIKEDLKTNYPGILSAFEKYKKSIRKVSEAISLAIPFEEC